MQNGTIKKLREPTEASAHRLRGRKEYSPSQRGAGFDRLPNGLRVLPLPFLPFFPYSYSRVQRYLVCDTLKQRIELTLTSLTLKWVPQGAFRDA